MSPGVLRTVLGWLYPSCKHRERHSSESSGITVDISSEKGGHSPRNRIFPLGRLSWLDRGHTESLAGCSLGVAASQSEVTLQFASIPAGCAAYDRPTCMSPTLSPGCPCTFPSRMRWAQLIRNVWQEDPLLCPRCGGTMRIIWHPVTVCPSGRHNPPHGHLDREPRFLYNGISSRKGIVPQ